MSRRLFDPDTTATRSFLKQSRTAQAGRSLHAGHCEIEKGEIDVGTCGQLLDGLVERCCLHHFREPQPVDQNRCESHAEEFVVIRDYYNPLRRLH